MIVFYYVGNATIKSIESFKNLISLRFFMKDGWIGLKVYIETYSGRKYTGKVISENSKEITIIDIKNKKVNLKRNEIAIMQEE